MQLEFVQHGVNVKMDLPYERDWIQRQIIHTGMFYEAHMLQDIRQRAKPDSVFVDIGANIGNHTLFFALVCKAKKVYSFEPQRDVYQILERNLKLNDLDVERVQTFNFGIGSRHAIASLSVPEGNCGGGALVDDPLGNVAVMPLTECIPPNVKIDFIKIDVEGMEMAVLEGAIDLIDRHKPYLYVELATPEEHARASEYLSAYGYACIGKYNATPTYLFEWDNSGR